MAKANGVEVTELSTHLQGQLVAVHPAYDEMFDGFAAPEVRGNPEGAAGMGGRPGPDGAAGLEAHGDRRDGDLLRRAGLALRLSLAAAAGGADRDRLRGAGAALDADPRRRRGERRRRLLRDPSRRGSLRRHHLRDVPRQGEGPQARQHALRPVALRAAVPRLPRQYRHLPRADPHVPRQGRGAQPDRAAGGLLRLRELGRPGRALPLASATARSTSARSSPSSPPTTSTAGRWSSGSAR